MAMTIDEAIESLKADYEIDMYIRDIATQIAEWLEELKAYRENKVTGIYIKRGYNKAIDDFAEKAKDMFADFDREHGYPTVGDCEDILQDVAEHLKAGDTDAGSI